MADVIPISAERRYIVQMLEGALVEAREGAISSLCLVYVRPNTKVGHHTYCAESTGMLIGTALMVASSAFIEDNLKVINPKDWDDKEPA